jgi:hypothetical protein
VEKFWRIRILEEENESEEEMAENAEAEKEETSCPNLVHPLSSQRRPNPGPIPDVSFEHWHHKSTYH